MAYKVETVVLEDGAEVELSFHPADETMSGWFLDMESVDEKDLEVILDKINELEGE